MVSPTVYLIAEVDAVCALDLKPVGSQTLLTHGYEKYTNTDRR